jgi:hypothetical protein
VCSTRFAIVLESLGSGVNTTLTQVINGMAIHNINPNEWNGGKKQMSTSFIFNHTNPAVHNISCNTFSCVNSTVFGKASLQDVNNTTAIFEIFLGSLNLLALTTAANFCLKDITFNISSKYVISYFFNQGV